MAEPETEFKPFVPANQSPPEFTLAPVIVGCLLGIVFGASSIYLVLKVGLTVSASIPVAVMSMALFRGLSAMTGLRRTSILENNIVQTTGSAGEGIAFAVGLALPALLLLGFDIDAVRVSTVGVLGGLLGILMMIPLRRAFIVKKHGELKYPEGTACAEVLIAGEKGGSTAATLLGGFGIGFVYQFLMKACKLWKDEPAQPLSYVDAAGKTVGLKGGVIGAEVSAPLIGVGYIIGPRIASIMVAGGVLAYLVLVPLIKFFGDGLTEVLPPAKVEMKDGENMGLIRNMDENDIRKNYILYIGAGAVAAGGILAMIQALPVIFGSLVSGLKDFLATRKGGKTEQAPRTERDMPMAVVVFGSLGMIAALMLAPSLGLGMSGKGIAGAAMILLFGFLFVTVSSRITGEIGSSSNPISGMTVAALLLTCLVLVVLSESGIVVIDKNLKLAALTIAAVVCVASSNGGTTSQALKTGHLLGATPRKQQYAILIGSLTSALVVGFVLILMNQAGTVYTKNKSHVPDVVVDVSKLTSKDHVRNGQYTGDTTEYFVWNLGKEETIAPGVLKSGDPETVKKGKYLVNAEGRPVYFVDPAINGELKKQDDGTEMNKFAAPKTQLVAMLIDGVLESNLPWGLVLIGVLIAVTLELSGVPALPFAVGVYLPIASSTPIFLGGMVRWLSDKLKRSKAEDGDSSPGVLLGSGYIAGGSIAAVLVAFLEFAPKTLKSLSLESNLPAKLSGHDWPAFAAFGLLAFVLLIVGMEPFRTRGRSAPASSPSEPVPGSRSATE
jgi:putative OPT family oligopeptide transporter